MPIHISLHFSRRYHRQRMWRIRERRTSWPYTEINFAELKINEETKVDNYTQRIPRPYFPIAETMEPAGIGRVLWTIPKAARVIEHLSKGTRGEWAYSRSFLLHDKTWVAQFCPGSGQFGIMLVCDATHVSSFSVESRIEIKTIEKKCNFNELQPIGIKDFMTPEEVISSIDDDGSWKFIIVVDPEE